MFKRIGLLVLANLAVFIMLSVILTVVQMVFGVNFGTMAGSSLNLSALFIFSMVVGFSGSIISLLMSKQMAKMSMGVQMIDTNNPQPGLEAYLVGVVRHEAERAGIPMPEVGIYEGEPNAFATGASASSAMVAVSTGLLNMMTTFVVFFSRIIGWVGDRQFRRNEDDAPGVGYYVTSLVLDICLGFLAGMVVAYFSRWREYHADAGAAEIMQSNQPMINALRRLGGMEAQNELPGAVKGFGISGGIGSLFATHPSIEYRIAALESRRY